MAKLYFIVIGFCFLSPAASASTRSSDILPHELPNIRVAEFLAFSAMDLEKLTGRKMNLSERISFVKLKSKMKKAVKKNPDLTVHEYIHSGKRASAGAVILYLLLGAVLLLFVLFLALYTDSK